MVRQTADVDSSVFLITDCGLAVMEMSVNGNTSFPLMIYILITIKVSKMTKVTSQALYKKNIEIKEKKKKINNHNNN